jgi:hypothetical protein
LTGVPDGLSAGAWRFKFEDVVSEQYGILTVPLRNPGGIMPLPILVVPQNVPLLIGADVLDAQQWYIRNVNDELVSTAGWTLPIARWQGHFLLRHGFDELRQRDLSELSCPICIAIFDIPVLRRCISF